MKKIKFLLFSLLAFSLVLLASADVTAQTKRDLNPDKKDFQTIEVSLDRVPATLQDGNQPQQAQIMAAALAKIEERSATRGDKDVRPNPVVVGAETPGKIKDKQGVTLGGQVKSKSIKTTTTQLKTPQRNEAEMKQKRQARIAELRKKLRKQ